MTITVQTSLPLDMCIGELDLSFRAIAAAGTKVIKHSVQGQPIRIRRDELTKFYEYAEDILQLSRTEFVDSSEAELTAYKEARLPNTALPTDWTGQ